MATTKGTNWTRRIPTPVGSETVSVVLIHTALTLGATNDILKITPIPVKGVTFTECFIRCSDMDTNGTPTLVFTLRWNDGTTQKVLIHQSTVGQAGGVIRPTKVPATETGIGYTTANGNGWLELLIDTQAATPAAGTLEVGLHMDGFYVTGAVTE